jgi:isopenicillin N synthase-like dioxygenase
MQAHRDCTVLSLLAQHDVDGLELQRADGTWFLRNRRRRADRGWWS